MGRNEPDWSTFQVGSPDGNIHPHREWGWAWGSDSLRMQILTGDAYLYRKCTVFVQGVSVTLDLN